MALAAPPITASDTRPAVDYMHTHPNCRCVMVPVLKSWDELGFPSVQALIDSGELDRERPDQTGEELLAQLPKATQQRILGKGRWNLWHRAKGRDGIPDGWGLRLDQMIHDTFDEDWGYTARMTRLDDLYQRLARDHREDAVNAERAERITFPWRFKTPAFDFASNPTPQNIRNRDDYRNQARALPPYYPQFTEAEREAQRKRADDIVAHWTTITAPDRAEVRIRVPASVLPDILRENRIKSQFETGTSLGLLHPEGRRRDEEKQFGYPPNLDPADRPIFGYLGPIDGNPDPFLVDQYGEVVVRLKPEVRRRTTFTPRDSIFQDLVPTPLEQPDAEAFLAEAYSTSQGKNPFPDHVGAVDGYAEAQIHGGVLTSDIAEVVFTIDPWAPANKRQPPAKEVTDRLDEAGIPWRVVTIDRPDRNVLYEAKGPVIEPPPAPVVPAPAERDEDWLPTLGRTAMEVPYVDRFRMRARRNAVVKTHREAIQWGELHGITQAEYLRRLDSAVTEALDPSRVEVRLRVPGRVLWEVLTSGRVKSQFETGTSQATLDPRGRAISEHNQFGYPDDTPPDQRPISAYVAPIRSELTTVKNYGGVVLRLENGVRPRTTVMSTDSLGPGLNREDRAEVTPMPIDEADNAAVMVAGAPYEVTYETVPEGTENAYESEELDDETGEYVKVWKLAIFHPWTAERMPDFVAPLRKVEQESPGARDQLTALEQDGIAAPRYDYWEAQIHGQVKVEDIAEIVFVTDVPDPVVLRVLEDVGIPYRVVGASPGEKGYVEGLTEQNWFEHPTHKRVDGVPMPHVTVTKARPVPAEIEPAPVAEEATLAVEEAAPLVTEEPPPMMGGPVEITPRTAAPPAALPSRVTARPIGKAEIRAFAVIEDRTSVFADPADTWRREDLTLNYGALATIDLPRGEVRESTVFVGMKGSQAVFARYDIEGILTAVATVSFDENGQVTYVRIRYAQAGEFTSTGRTESDLFTTAPYQDAVALLDKIDVAYGKKEDLPPGLLTAPAPDSERRRIWEEAVIIRAEVARILGVKPEDSKWIGAFEDTERNARGFFSWHGAIALKANWTEMSIRDRYEYLVHEILHSFSPGMAPIHYRENPGLEEGVAEALTERIVKEIMLGQDYAVEGWTDREGYAEYVNPLEEIADLIGYEDDDTPFFTALFKIPLKDRQAWIVDQYAARGESHGWNSLFLNLRRLNIENPMDWGGATSRSRLTDRQIDVETLEDLSRAIYTAGATIDPESRTDWAKSKRAFYEPLARATKSVEIGQILYDRMKEIDALPDGTARLGGLEARNELFMRLSGAQAGVVLSRRRDLGVMMEPSHIPPTNRWHNEGLRNQTTLSAMAVEAGLPGDAGLGVSRGTMTGRHPSGQTVAVIYDTEGWIRQIAYSDGNTVSYWMMAEPDQSDLDRLRDALQRAEEAPPTVEEQRQPATARVDAPDQWVIDTSAEGRTVEEWDAKYQEIFGDAVSRAEQIISVRTPPRWIRVAFRTLVGEPAIIASLNTENGSVLYAARPGMNPDYIAEKIPYVHARLVQAAAADVLVISTQGRVVDMGTTPEEQNAPPGRDPGTIDMLTPEADEWTVGLDGLISPTEGDEYARRRGLTRENPFKWRTSSLIDGAIFYADGSVKARVDVLWRSGMVHPVVSVTPVQGNEDVLSPDDLHAARRALVTYLEGKPESARETDFRATMTQDRTRILTREEANAYLRELLAASGDQPTANTTRLVQAMIRAENHNTFPVIFEPDPDGNVPILQTIRQTPPISEWRDTTPPGGTTPGLMRAAVNSLFPAADIPTSGVLVRRDRAGVHAVLTDYNGEAMVIATLQDDDTVDWASVQGATPGGRETRLGRIQTAIDGFLFAEAQRAGAPVETTVPVVYTRLSPEEVFVKVGEGYMGPRRPLINAFSPGEAILSDSGFDTRPTIENGIERLEGRHAIGYAYVENGQVRAVLLAGTGPGGFLRWTGDEDRDRQTAPYILNYDRTMDRESLLRITGEMRKAFFVDGHIPQPGESPRIVVPPGTEPVDAQPSWTGIGTDDHVLNLRSLGLDQIGTPNTFEQGTDSLHRNWVSMRGESGFVNGIGYTASSLHGAEPGHIQVEIPNRIDNADRREIAQAIGREMERRGLTWRWRDDDKGRRLAQEAKDRALVANARTDAAMTAMPLGYPTAPAVTTHDGVIRFTTPGGVKGQYQRSTWGDDLLFFEGVPDPDEAVAMVTAAREEWTRWTNMIASFRPPLSRFMPQHSNETAFDLPEGTSDGFSTGRNKGVRWYTLKTGDAWVTVTVAGNFTAWYASPGRTHDEAYADLKTLLPQIEAYEQKTYPDWRVRLQTGPMQMSPEGIRTVESTGIMPYASDTRTLTAEEIDDLGQTLVSLDRDLMANASYIANESPGYMAASTADATFRLAQDEWSDDYRWEIRRATHPTEPNRTIWYAIVIRKSDGAVMGYARIGLLNGRARNETWEVMLPAQEGGVTPMTRAAVLEHLAYLVSTRRPAFMSTLERTYDQVAFTQYDETDENQKTLIERAREAMPRAHRNETAFWLDFDPETSTGNLVMTQEGLMVGVMKVTHAEYTPKGTFIATPDQRGKFPDDNIIRDAVMNSQGQRVEAPGQWTEGTPRNRLPKPPLVTSTSDESERVAIDARRFPLNHEPGSVIRVQAGSFHIWQTYDTRGHRSVTFRQRITADGTPTGALEVYVSVPDAPVGVDLPGLWAETYAASPIAVADPDSIMNVMWRDPRLTSENERVDDPVWLAANGVPDAFGDVSEMTTGVYEGPQLPGARVLYEVENGRLIQALVIPVAIDGRAIPGILGVRVAQIDTGVWGPLPPNGADVRDLRMKAVSLGYITEDTLFTLGDWSNADLVANRIVYNYTTTDDAERWDEIIDEQISADWVNYYGKRVADLIPDAYKRQGLDVDFDSSAITVIANQFGYDNLVGPPDTFHFVKWDRNREGAVLYYDTDGALAGCVTVGLTNGKVNAVHWNRVHASKQRRGIALRDYHWATTIGIDIERESGRHGLTTIGGTFRDARIADPRARWTLGLSRMRPEFGDATTFDEVMEKRNHPVIAEAHKTVVADLEALDIETIPDSAPETYYIGTLHETHAVAKTTPTLGIFESSSEPSMRVELDPARATPDDVDLAAAYEVRKQEQDAVVFTAIGFGIKRIPGATVNGRLFRVEGISTRRIRALYSAVAELTPNANIDDARGVVEFSLLGDPDDDTMVAWRKLAQDFGGTLTITPAHIRWYWHDEAARAAATWFPTGEPGVVSLTADEVIASLKGKKDGRADQIPGNRATAKPVDTEGVRPPTGRRTTHRRRRVDVAPGADGEPGPEAGPDVAPRAPVTRTRTRRAYDAPHDGSLTAAVPHEPDLAAVRVEAESIMRSISERFGVTNLHWSGAVRRELHPPVEGDAYLDWDGTLVLTPDFDQYNEEGQRGIIAHEMMHAVSNSGDVGAYVQYAMLEEGLAEALAIQWRSEHDVRTQGAYALAVQGIDMLADLIGMPRQQFYEVMLATPLDQRPAKVLQLALSRPTHEDLIGPGFADPREAILFTIAWMEPDVDDAGAIVKLLHRVQAETGYGPARMRVLMENLIRQPIGNWMGIIERAAQERNVDIGFWVDPTVNPLFPFTSHSLRAHITDRIGDALGRSIGGALNAPPPTPFNPYSAQARRVKPPKRVKPSFLFTRRLGKGRIGIGGNAPPEEPVTRRAYGPMLAPPGAV